MAAGDERDADEELQEMELFAEPESESESEEDGPDSADASFNTRSSASSRGSVPPPAPPGGPLPVADSTQQDDIPRRELKIIAVAGARGGVGKTVLAANLGLYLATIGRRVLMVDADPGGANLHSCLGCRSVPPLPRMKKGGRGEAIPESAMHSTPIPNLRLLHAGFDEPAGSGPRGDRLGKLMGRLRHSDVEYVVVDLGVGAGRELLDAYLAADLAVFVSVPEPTAMENTYRFLRGLFARFVTKRLQDEELAAELERRLKTGGGAPVPLDLLNELEQEEHPLALDVREALEHFRPNLVINQTRLRADLHLGSAVQSAARRRLGFTVELLGHVDHDDSVWTCVRSCRPLLLEVPGAKSSKKIEKVARRILLIEAGKHPRPARELVPVESHHDLLEVERGATDEEVRRAYKRCREVYSPDALCVYGLFEPHEIERTRAQVDEAFDVLLDPARRRPYELSVFPDEPEPRPPSEVERMVLEPPRPAPDISPDTQFTGALLRQARESQRIPLADISRRTKVGVSYLKAIEEDDFSKLPAVVYANGFVSEFARYLKLDAQQVSRTYIRRYKQYLDDKEKGFARR